jgi:2-oxoglutarate dehydrogenase E2 component (dihydrolipoamide succinyltransferase)
MNQKKEIKVPPMGESITEATIARWLKQPGDAVTEDEPLVELETDKVTLEVGCPMTGVLSEVLAKVGGSVEVGATIGYVTEGTPHEAPRKNTESSPKGKALAIEKAQEKPDAPSSQVKDDRVERVPMTRLRQRIAERLKEAQNTAAILTTFNEVDMTHVMTLRRDLKEAFEEKHGVKLGFMSFFIKACLVALKEIPAVNAEIDGHDLIYKNYYDIGIAVGAPQGLVVPVVRDVEQKSFAQIEKDIADLGEKARLGKLAMQDLQGGTFTISNGGVYGSLMSTPILNPPQSGILGMHKIQDRPVAIEGNIEIRPMMYIALSYDHRIIDGREAVTFLVRVKDCLENPERLLLGM